MASHYLSSGNEMKVRTSEVIFSLRSWFLPSFSLLEPWTLVFSSCFKKRWILNHCSLLAGLLRPSSNHLIPVGTKVGEKMNSIWCILFSFGILVTFVCQSTCSVISSKCFIFYLALLLYLSTSWLDTISSATVSSESPVLLSSPLTISIILRAN